MAHPSIDMNSKWGKCVGISNKFYFSVEQSTTMKDTAGNDGFKRKLSKREKKQLKKLQEKNKTEKGGSTAEKLYNGENLTKHKHHKSTCELKLNATFSI